MSEKAKYTIVGRYMDGSTVTAYHLLDGEGQQRRVTREQVIFLVGRGEVSNCKGQLHKESVLLRGVGINITDLPIVNEKTGELKNTDGLGRIARGSTNEQAISQLMIVGKVVSGNKVVGFTVANAGGRSKDISRAQANKLAKQMRIGNARYQEYKGRGILRVLDCGIKDLPITSDIGMQGNVE